MEHFCIVCKKSDVDNEYTRRALYYYCNIALYVFFNKEYKLGDDISEYNAIHYIDTSGNSIPDKLFNLVKDEIKLNKENVSMTDDLLFHNHSVLDLLSDSLYGASAIIAEFTNKNVITIYNFNTIIIINDDNIIFSVKLNTEERKSYKIKIIEDSNAKLKEIEEKEILIKREKRKKKTNNK